MRMTFNRLVLWLLLLLVLLLLQQSSSGVTAFSAPHRSRPTPISRPFQTFQFAPDGVCLNPRYFYDPNDQYFTMCNVPGDGDCMFMAVALAAATSMGWGGTEDAWLRGTASDIRDTVAQVLESPTGTLYIGKGRPVVTAQELLKSATRKEGLTSTDEYLQRLRTEGREGGLYGGGPELTVLSNVLRRPISVYELAPPPFDDGTSTNINTSTNIITNTNSTCPMVCQGTFGDGLFEDPGFQVPHSAVTQGAPYYTWHLHILVLNVSPNEKHACALFPARKPKPGTDATLRP